MANLFDRSNYPRIEPDQVVVGEYITWRKDDLASDYPPDSYSLRYNLRSQNSTATEIEITATEAESTYFIEIPIATSASYTKGSYNWQATIIRASDLEELVVLSGTIELLQSYDDENADPRSHEKKTLDLIEALIEGKAVSDVDSYSIQGRSLSKMNIQELLKWRDYYKKEYNKELKKLARAKGKSANNNIYIQFN